MHTNHHLPWVVALLLTTAGCASSLLQATRDGDRQAVARLLRVGQDPNASEEKPEGKRGPTPLFEAITQHDLELVKVLVEGGANVNLKSNCEGAIVSPLEKAALHGDAAIVLYLASKGADPTSADSGQNVFEWLAWRANAGSPAERKAVVKAVFRALDAKLGADKVAPFLDTQSASGWTPLALAVYQDDEQLVRLLLERGASVHARAKVKGADPSNSDEWAPIHFAAVYERGSMQRLLAQAGASPDEPTRDGKTVSSLLADIAQRRAEELERGRIAAVEQRREEAQAARERVATWGAMQRGLTAGMQQSPANPVDDDSFQRRMQRLGEQERERKERAQAREREEREREARERREQRARDAEAAAANRRAIAGSPSTSTASTMQPSEVARNTATADDARQKEEARLKEEARKEEARKKEQERRDADERRKAEARQKEEERRQEDARRKAEAEQQKRAAAEASRREWEAYLSALRTGIRLRATRSFCAENGGYCAAGTWPKGVIWKGAGSGMVTVTFRATCVNKLNWSGGTLYNFVGGTDTAPIRPKPDCPIEDVRVEVTEVRGGK